MPDREVEPGMRVRIQKRNALARKVDLSYEEWARVAGGRHMPWPQERPQWNDIASPRDTEDGEAAVVTLGDRLVDPGAIWRVETTLVASYTKDKTGRIRNSDSLPVLAARADTLSGALDALEEWTEEWHALGLEGYFHPSAHLGGAARILVEEPGLTPRRLIEVSCGHRDAEAVVAVLVALADEAERLYGQTNQTPIKGKPRSLEQPPGS